MHMEKSFNKEKKKMYQIKMKKKEKFLKEKNGKIYQECMKKKLLQ